MVPPVPLDEKALEDAEAMLTYKDFRPR